MDPVAAPSSIDRKTLIAGAVMLVVGIALGVIVGQNLGSSKQVAKSNGTVSTAGSNKLFLGQSASAQGQIVAVGSNKITVLGPDGQKNDFQVSPNVNIYIYKDRNTPATVSNDLRSVPLNQDVLINMGMQNGEYVVTTLTFDPTSSIPSSPSSKP